MTTPDDLEIIRRLERLAEIEPNRDSAARAVDRARAVLLNPPPAPSSWRRSALLGAKIAAGVLLAAGVVGLVWWLLSSPTGAGIAFADVQEKVQKTRTVTFTLTQEQEGRTLESERILIQAPNLLRVEMPDGQVSITDYAQRKWLQINPAKKEARLVQGLGLALPNIYDLLRNVPKDATKRLPEKQIGGKKTLGFLAPIGAGKDQQMANVWVDAETRLPVRLEIAGKNAKGQEVRQVFSDLVFDRPLDAALFSLAPPKGYTLHTEGLAVLPPAPKEQDLLAPVVTPLVGIGPARFGMSKEEVIKELGNPDAIPPEGRGKMLNYFSRGFSVTVTPMHGLLMISCVTQKTFLTKVRDFKGKTKEGIAMGSSAKDIENAYGKPDRREANGTVFLHYPKLNLDFVLYDDKVVGFMVQAPRKQ